MHVVERIHLSSCYKYVHAICRHVLFTSTAVLLEDRVRQVVGSCIPALALLRDSFTQGPLEEEARLPWPSMS